ncbi:hypothetical protein ACFC25_04150 [Pseudarthrobacter sp. NPDC055928]|uniref:hypothetical protein n=1 Tax=Pseudarthrobacter sp. NPDC055928 TaxID=3345661 RepID=UPI0035D57A95
MNFRLKVRNDANGYYAHARGKVMTEPFASLEDANAVLGAMVNGAEFEVIEEGL